MAGNRLGIALEGLNVTLGGFRVLRDITAQIAPGSYTAVIGPNGAGKTTLLKSILNLVPYSGRIEFRNEAGSALARPTIGYVPQSLEFDRGSSISVQDFLVLSTAARPLWFGVEKTAVKSAQENLAKVGLESSIDQRLGELSGGQKQRVMLARALMQQPQIMLYDEPMSQIDMQGEALFCDLLDDLRINNKITIVLVSHDLSIVSRHADHVISINHEMICQGEVTEVITTETIKEIYGVHMGFHRHKH